MARERRPLSFGACDTQHFDNSTHFSYNRRARAPADGIRAAEHSEVEMRGKSEGVRIPSGRRQNLRLAAMIVEEGY